MNSHIARHSFMPDNLQPRRADVKSAADFHSSGEIAVMINNRAVRKAALLQTTAARAVVLKRIDAKCEDINSKIDTAIRCAAGNNPNVDEIVAAVERAAVGVERDPRLDAMLRGLDRAITRLQIEIAADESRLRNVLNPDHLQALGIAINEPSPPPPVTKPAPPAPELVPDPEPLAPAESAIETAADSLVVALDQ